MRVDVRAVTIGAAIALGIAVPAALLGQLPGEDSALVFLFFAIILAGCVVGGFVAASKRPDTPLTHGALAALCAYLVVQAIAVILLTVRGEDVPVVVIVFNAFLAASAGLLGGMLADRGAARL